jgi:hypothetical protein
MPSCREEGAGIPRQARHDAPGTLTAEPRLRSLEPQSFAGPSDAPDLPSRRPAGAQYSSSHGEGPVDAVLRVPNRLLKKAHLRRPTFGGYPAHRAPPCIWTFLISLGESGFFSILLMGGLRFCSAFGHILPPATQKILPFVRGKRQSVCTPTSTGEAGSRRTRITCQTSHLGVQTAAIPKAAPPRWRRLLETLQES